MSKDKYRNFEELEKGEDTHNYRIIYKDRSSHISIIAPHGGKIEGNTTEIAEAIANDKFNYYSFIGERRNENKKLHITSHKFDEPKALELVGKSEIVVAIHGCQDRQDGKNYKKHIFIGGLNKELKDELEKVLSEAGLSIGREKFKGKEKNNICNRTPQGGVQFELTASFRNDAKLRNRFIHVVRENLLTNAS